MKTLVWASALVLGISVSGAFAAGPAPGTVRVEVTDGASGAAIPNATVTLSTGASGFTGADGAFTASGIPISGSGARVDVTVRASGYDKALWRAADAYPGDTTILPFRMTSTGREKVIQDPPNALASADGAPTMNADGSAAAEAAPDASGGGASLLGPEPLYIRVWRVQKSNEAGKTIVENIPFEEYVKGVVPREWFSSWHAESLKAGCVAARTYGWYNVLHPKYPSIGADVSDTTASQVYGDSRVASTNSAADATRGQVMTYNNVPINAEYSAENGDPTTAGPYPYQPSVDDPVCAGQTLNGHGRGLCQWGSQRWATGTTGSGGAKTYDWILDHYYGSAAVLQTAGQGLEVGDCAAVEGGAASVRSSANGPQIATMPAGTLVHLAEGPTRVGSVNWWRVEWPLPAPTRSDGWVSDALLVETECPDRGIAVTNVTTSDITLTSAVVQWETPVEATSVVHYGSSAGSLPLTATGVAGTSHSVTLSGLTSGATYFYKVESGAGGYVDGTSAIFNFNTLAPPPAIVISQFGVQNRYADSVDVFWETDEPADTTIFYGPTPDALTQTATGLAGTRYHSATLTSLQPDTSYYVRAESAADGYVTAASDVLEVRTLKLLAFSDVTATDVTKDGATLTWTLNAPAAVDVTYGAVSGALDNWQPVEAGTTQLALTGLTPGTTYYYQLAASAEGYAPGETPEQSFQTPPAALAGDADGDGAVTWADAALAVRIAAGMETLSADATARTDIAGPDGVVTVEDALAISKLVSTAG
jgi:hypothetical protein